METHTSSNTDATASVYNNFNGGNGLQQVEERHHRQVGLQLVIMYNFYENLKRQTDLFNTELEFP